MASALQQAVTGIQLNNYMTRMLIDLGVSIHLTDVPSRGPYAIGYDYSEQYMFVSISSCWMKIKLDSPYILK